MSEPEQPSTDAIVARLRDMSRKRYAPAWAGWVQEQCTAAADEIERLRDALRKSGDDANQA